MKYGLNMDSSVVDHCIGKVASFRAVTELKQLNVQPVGKRDLNPRKMNSEKRRAKRIAARRH